MKPTAKVIDHDRKRPPIAFYEQAARAKNPALEGLTACEWEVMSDTVVKIGFAATTKFKRGPRKGTTKYIDPFVAEYVSESEALLEAEKWAAAGKCVPCVGEGRLFLRWSSTTGTTYRPCPACSATAGEQGGAP